ncbi:MAG: tetratricopeptide repeat protein [Flavobacteriales bacterium]|nr:tetratricopeptide repeat protein [Flavobacteriales bacterium]
MKRYLLTAALALTISLSYAQKAELTEAQKAFDKKDYQSALANAEKADAIIKQNPTAVPSAMVAQAMYLKGASSLELAGENVSAVANAVKQLSEVVAYEKGKDYSARNISTKKVENFPSQEALDEAMISGGYDKQKIVDRVGTYSPSVTAKLSKLSNDLYKKAIECYNAGQYANAASYFDATFDAQAQCTSRPDTSVYNNSAACMLQLKDYAKAAQYYKKLISMGYTGIETIYEATNVLSGKRQTYASKKDRDAEVKLKVAVDPSERTEPNKQPEIYTTLMQILFQEGKDAKPVNFDEFLKYAKEAVAKYPETKEFILMEGQAYYELKDTATFLATLQKAESIFPTDAMIQYNMGYIYSEKNDKENALAHYKKAIELDPKYADAYINIASVYLEENEAVNKEISDMPFSLNKEQKKRYDELLAKSDAIVKKAIAIMEKGFEANPDNTYMAKNLENLYGRLGDKANEKKYADIFAKLTGM